MNTNYDIGVDFSILCRYNDCDVKVKHDPKKDKEDYHWPQRAVVLDRCITESHRERACTFSVAKNVVQAIAKFLLKLFFI